MTPNPRRLNYQHLLYFWTVVRTGGVVRASEELALSAPSISAQLRTLEARLGEKLLAKSGRKLVPTEMGRLVYGYADEIFRIGGELLDAIEQRPGERSLRLMVGIDDVVPKEIAYRILRPATTLGRPVRLTCREGTLDRLAADLAVHELDVVLSDAPLASNVNVRAFSHGLGTWETVWMATPALARTLRRGFPGSLDGVPVLLPTDDTAIRRKLDRWLATHGIRPRTVGEFEDYGLLREFVRAGHGFAPVPSLLESQFREQYGVARIDVADGVTGEFFAITVERRIRNPAVAAMIAAMRKD